MSSLTKLSLAACLLFTAQRSAASIAAEQSHRPLPERDRFVFHGGISGVFDEETVPAFATEYRWAAAKAGLQPWVGGGWATDGAIFAGAGVLHTWRPARRWEFVAGFGPGYYDRHEGLDLGSQVEFYSFAEVNCAVSTGKRLLVRFAHISNASMSEINPGTELLTLGFSFDLR
jgi:lipid A 3-O-deacylase